MYPAVYAGMFRLVLVCAFAFPALVLPFDRAAAQTPIKFVLNWKIDGSAGPLLLAIDKGYFKAEGLDVSVVEPVFPEPDETANGAVRRVAAGDGELGLGDINSLIRRHDQAAPTAVKAVYVVYNKPAYAVIGRKSRGVAVPRDLEGKRIGAPTRDPSTAEWKIFTNANGLDPAKMTIENIGMPVREPMLAAGQVDAVTALSYYSYIDLKDRGVPASDIVVMLMADNGVKLYGDAIVVAQKFSDEHPEQVRAFLRAYTKALKDTIARPQTAIDAVLKRDSSLRKDLELDRLKMVIRDNIQTAETKAQGYGGIDPKRFAEGIDQIGAVFEFKQKPKSEDVFDASFLPSPALRKE